MLVKDPVAFYSIKAGRKTSVKQMNQLYFTRSKCYGRTKETADALRRVAVFNADKSVYHRHKV